MNLRQDFKPFEKFYLADLPRQDLPPHSNNLFLTPIKLSEKCPNSREERDLIQLKIVTKSKQLCRLMLSNPWLCNDNIQFGFTVQPHQSNCQTFFRCMDFTIPNAISNSFQIFYGVELQARGSMFMTYTLERIVC